MSVPRFTGFSISTEDPSPTVAFYRAMGFEAQEDKHGGGRSCIDASNQHFDVDDLARVPTWNAGIGGAGVTLGFEVDGEDDVDELVERLAGLGYVVQQPAYDAPWGRRFAVVEDPAGTPVAIMSSESR